MSGYLQPWCARLQYPGLEPRIFGTVWVEKDRQEEARQRIAELWASVDPHPLPPIVEMLPGALVFSPAGEA